MSDETRSEATQTSTTPNPLDKAWEQINALGGSDLQNNSYDQGFVDAIGKALEVIESLGGKDPLAR
jgi:hypothetical protein